MRSTKRGLLFIVGVALLTFEIAFQPIALVREEAPDDTLEYVFEKPLEGIPAEKPQPGETPTPEKQATPGAPTPTPKRQFDESHRLTVEELKREIRELLTEKGVDLALTADAVTVTGRKVRVRVVLEPGHEREEAERYEKIVLQALNEKYGSRAGKAKRVVEKPPEPDLIMRIGRIKIVKPRPRVRLGLDLQGGKHVVLEAAPAASFTIIDPKQKPEKPKLEKPTEEEKKSAEEGKKEEGAARGVSPLRIVHERPGADKWNKLAYDLVDYLKARNIEPRRIVVLENGLGVSVGITDAPGQGERDGKQKAQIVRDFIRKRVPTAELQGEVQILALKPGALQGLRDVIERRVNALGVAEAIVQVEQPRRIIVEVPGKNPDMSFAEPAELEFVYVDPNKYEFDRRVDENGEEHVVVRDKLTGKEVPHEVVLSDPTTDHMFFGKDLKPNAAAAPDPNAPRYYQVHFEFKPQVAAAFRRFTAQHIGKPMPIVLNGEIISAPVIKSAIPGRGVIEGNFTGEEAQRLAVLLNAGALPIPVTVAEDRTVSATLGHYSIQKSFQAGVLGVIAVLLFMLGYYRLPGFLADVALALYIVLVLAALVSLDATLTLTGIAGLILSIGMAVDANVIIFERLKEELQLGKPFRIAAETAFARAWTAIVDANVTTVLGALVLWIFGTGAVRGFATTLIIGVLCSLFTAITVTKVLLMSVMHTRIINKPWLFLGAQGRQ